MEARRAANLLACLKRKAWTVFDIPAARYKYFDELTHFRRSGYPPAREGRGPTRDGTRVPLERWGRSHCYFRAGATYRSGIAYASMDSSACGYHGQVPSALSKSPFRSVDS